ncbi:MAG: family 78 glycoside hydrolase catalytic domain [Melioribacteraceae bacterium]|nr:family 78 glycoside hydrolase catalytic domain [Melioribacteraceae bacterium]
MKKLIIFLFVIYINTVAQESDVKINYQGKDYTKLKHAWIAQWITHPTESTLDFGVFFFRKDFHLTEVPHEFLIYTSADNKYRLFVNGNYVGFGPATGDINNYFYDTYDISKYLQIGKNVIAVEVINFGEFRRAAQQTFQTAFILQSKDTSLANLNTGQTNWKVTKNNAYSYIPFTPDSLKTYYAAGPGELIDYKHFPSNWNQINYNDTIWQNARRATVEFAVGKGFLYGSTWFLVERNIPYLKEEKEYFKKFVYNKNALVDTINVGKNIVVKKKSNATILFDMTYHTTGYPELTFRNGAGSKIKITYSEALFKKINENEKVTDGNLLFVDLKGNRNDCTNKEIFGYYDILFPEGKNESITFKPFGKRTFRFVQLDIQTKDDELIIEDFYNVYTGYPYKQVAEFKTNDALLNKIWDVSWLTIKNSSDDTFIDPYYEQLQYIGDTRIEALVAKYMTGDEGLFKKALEQFDQSRIPEGLTQSRYPSYIVQIIPTYSLMWVNMLHDYLYYGNEPYFIKKFLPGMNSVLNWFIQKIDSTGLPTNLTWWNFTDWTDGFPNGIPPGADDSYSANVSMQLLLALKNATEISKYFNELDSFRKYEKLYKKLKKKINEKFYDNKKNLFAETIDENIYSQHTNIFAILSDAVDKPKQKELMKKILNDKSLIQASIYFRFYLFRALQKTKNGNTYTTLLQPWQNMISQGMTTFGETDINPRSDCHAWSASPGFDFLHTIVGIYPTKIGFNEFNIEPNLGNLKFVEAKYPIRNEFISVKYSKENSQLKVMIDIPNNITASFIYKNKVYKIKNGVNELNIKL